MNDVCRLWSWRPGHWANWAFEIGATDADKGMFDFAKGGFQGGRGHAHGAEWFVENVFEVGHLLASCFLPMIAPPHCVMLALHCTLPVRDAVFWFVFCGILAAC